MSEELLDASATRLATLIRERRVSAEEVVRCHIDRIEAVNPRINAVVVPRFEQALDEARAADHRLGARSGKSDGPLPPLLGVPCTIKEFLEMPGMPNTGGLIAHRRRTGIREATVVSRIRRAGAIVMGLTNVPEGGLWMEADSKVYGRTNNPHDLARSPGGSSGGEGAIVAAGGSPLGLGADIGGSIRIPAAFCGVVGHKPSGRLVPTTGHFPTPVDALLPALCLGPMARRVEDLITTLPLLAGPDGHCRAVRSMTLLDPASVRLEELTVYRLDPGSRPRIRPVMNRAIQRSLDVLRDRGARVDVIEAPELRYGVEMWAAFLEDGSRHTTYADVLSPDRPMNAWLELLKLPLGRSRHTLAALVMVAAEDFTRMAPKRARRMLEHLARLRRRLHDRMGDRGVFLLPPYTRPAPRHVAPLLTPFDAACTCTFNPLEMAVTVVPVDRSDDGLPVAVQVGALPGRDHLSLAVAKHLEDALGGWTRAEPGRG